MLDINKEMNGKDLQGIETKYCPTKQIEAIETNNKALVVLPNMQVMMQHTLVSMMQSLHEMVSHQLYDKTKNIINIQRMKI